MRTSSRLLVILSFALLCLIELMGQGIKLKQIEPCIDPITRTRSDSCFTITDLNGYQYYIHISQLKTILGGDVTAAKLCQVLGTMATGAHQTNDYVLARNQTTGSCRLINASTIPPSASTLCTALKSFGIASYDDGANVFVEMPDGSCKKINLQDIVGQGGTFNCDSVAYCLLQEGVLCDALNAYGTTNGIPDYIIGVENGNCFRVDGSLFGGGGVNCGQIDSCLANSDTLCDLIKDCLIGDDFFCQMVDSCLQNSDSLCAYVEDCLETFNWDSIVCVGLNGIPESTYEDGDSAIIVRDGSCYKIAWHCCDSSNGQNLIAGDCIDITGDTISVKVDPSNDNLLECTSNGLFVDKNLCGTYDVNDLTNGDYWIINRVNECFRVPVRLIGDNCVSMQLDAGAIRTGIIISNDNGNIVECRANGLYAKAKCDYSDGGILAHNDKIVVQSGTDCVVKTFESPCSGGFISGQPALVYGKTSDQRCGFFAPCFSPCFSPDAPQNNVLVEENTKLKKQVAALEKQNREFEKRLKLLESKLK